MIWNKFKSQFISLIVSIILIAVIFSVYDDLHKVLKISDKDSVVGLLLLKWFLLALIFGYNWYSFSKLKSNAKKQSRTSDNTTTSYNGVKVTKQYNSPTESTESIHHQNILNKKKLKTKTDVILKKYINGGK